MVGKISSHCKILEKLSGGGPVRRSLELKFSGL